MTSGARNILLYSLVCSGESLDEVWNVFYHFYLDEKNYRLLESQSRLLASASVSMQSWQSSRFGAYLKICSTHTLSELHRHWELYVAFSSLAHTRHNHLSAEQRQLSKDLVKKQVIISISRSAGMHWEQAVLPMQDAYDRYWRTGTTFNSTQGVTGATKLNPTFVYHLHGETFNPHYATFPLQAFHLSDAFAPVHRDITNKPPIDVVKDQFRAWCSAFREATCTSPGSIVIRFCVGDVLSFCTALDHTSKGIASRLFVSPSSGEPLEIDGELPPPAFDVIDTSNLMDHLGLLNLLISTRPLLKPIPTSVLYTETLLPQGKDATVAVLGRMCGDVPTMSLLVGLTPRTLLSGFSAHCNVHELLFSFGDPDQRQFHERVIWCDPSSGDPPNIPGCPIVVDSAELGALLFHVYDQICADEKVFENLRNPDVYKMQELQHHDRASFAKLVRLAMSRITPGLGGWPAAVDAFLALVAEDRGRLVGMNYYQELCLLLHVYGISTTPSLSPRWRYFVPDSNDFSIFRGWDDIPPVVCVVLSVPTHKLKVFEGTEDLGSMPLMCNLFTTQHDNAFACNIQAVAGHVEAFESSTPPSLRIVCNERGVKDARFLVLSFLAPSWLLTLPRSSVRFAIKSTPLTTAHFMRKLGGFLELFSAPLTDTRHVRVTKHRPGLFRDPDASEVLPRVDYARTLPAGGVTVQLDKAAYKCVKTITAKLELSTMGFTSPVEPSVSITAQQTGACTMEVTVGDQRGSLHFPYPIKGGEHKLRIARKSLYVEVSEDHNGHAQAQTHQSSQVIAPPFFPPQSGSATAPVNVFPVLKTVAPTPWNLHHVNLDAAPILALDKKGELGMIATHTAFQFSIREASIAQRIDHASVRSSAPLVSLKACIQAIINTVAGVGRSGSRARVFRVVQEGSEKTVLLIVVHQLRLDLASFTLLADAAVIPFDESVSDKYDAVVSSANPDTLTVLTVPATDEEMAIWKQYLPAVVERSRRWSHTPNCEYTATGHVPLPTQPHTPSTICTCGRGRSLPDKIPGVPDGFWDALRPYATRAAISPLFAVSYLEPVVAPGASRRLMDAEVLRRVREVQGRTMVTTAGDGAGPSTGTGSLKRCMACGGPGKPKLLLCGKCKKAKYCSPACNRSDWKVHKLVCRTSA